MPWQSFNLFLYLTCSLYESDECSEFDTSFQSVTENESLLQDPLCDRKFVVFESALLSLFRDCRSCGLSVTLNTSLYGTLLVIKAICPDGHTFTWYSQPFVGRAPAGNILLSAAILFSGSTYTTFSNIADILNLSVFNEATFYRIQKTHIFPIIDTYYKQNQIV